MSALDLKALKQAIKTLQGNQGFLARRNARTRVVDALRGVRQAMDKEYPAPPRKPTKRRTLTIKEKRKQLIREGYVIVRGGTLAKLAEAGVTVRYTRAGDSGGSTGWFDAAAWMPGWATYLYEHGGISKVAAARKSPGLIKAARAAMRLGGYSPDLEDIKCPEI